MKITNLNTNKLMYCFFNNRIIECKYNYTNRNGKKNITYKCKLGFTDTFVPKGTVFYDNKKELLNYMEAQKEKEKAIKEQTEKQYQKEIEEYESKLINALSNCENINSLLLLDQLNIMIEEEVLMEIWQDKIIYLKDGTKVELVRNQRCINKECYEVDVFYYIPEINTYICVNCGTWLKDYTSILNELDNNDFAYIYLNDLLLPSNWDEDKVRTYYKKKLTKKI